MKTPSRVAGPLGLAVAVASALAMLPVSASQADESDPPTLIISTTTRSTERDLGRPCTSNWPEGRCASEDPNVTLGAKSTGDTTECTFRVTVDWGDGTTTTSDTRGVPDGGQIRIGQHTYADKPRPRRFPIAITGQVVNGACWFTGGNVTFRLTCTAESLTDAGWADQFPGTSRIEDLDEPFQGKVRSFIGAMRAAGIHVSPLATFRPAQRAYMMHYGWLIARGSISPKEVPAFAPQGDEAPIDICWVHPKNDGTYDADASKAGARQLLRGLGVDPELGTAPALRGRHTTREAIDMRTTWDRERLTIENANGREITIDTRPRNGLNAQLMRVGATYGVHHFRNPEQDRNHWSSDGR